MDDYDEDTLAFYNREASTYAARREAKMSAKLEAFVQRVGAGAKVLELGTGGGQDAWLMLQAGIDVTPTDGSAGLAAQASAFIGREVSVMRFDELEAESEYDGVWANASLLHVPSPALPGVLTRVSRALKPGGVFFASYKSGDGGDRDALGRYYNFPTREALEEAYRAAARWRELTIDTKLGGGYDGVERLWLFCMAVK
jgi:SAM-dependent methyltransferase